MLWSSPSWDAVTYWSLDLETGGLDPGRDPILAVGMLPIRGGVIRLGEAYQSLVRPDEPGLLSPASVRAHQLVPRELATAPALPEVLPEVDRRLREGAMLVHDARVDVRFLRKAYRACGLRWWGPAVIDTMGLLLRLARRRRLVRPDAAAREPGLNLSTAREQRGLPGYHAHDALTDAIATAELFLVLRHQLGARSLRDLR